MRTTYGPRFLGDLSGTSLRDEAGTYSWPPNSENPDKYLSVTSILSTLNKPGLNKWHAAKERDYVKSRMEAMRRGEVKGREILDEFCSTKDWTSKAEDFRNERAELGSAVHHEVTKYVIAKESGYNPIADMGEDTRIAPFMRSFEKWFEQECPSYLFVEGPVFNRKEGYAGTSDALIAFRDGTYIVDYKISPKSTRDHSLQLAAYRHCDFIGVRNTGAEIPLPKTDGGKILLIHEDGCKLHDHQCGEREYEVFLKTMDVHKWRNFEYEASKEEW